MTPLTRRIELPRDREQEAAEAGERPPRREWLVTNGLGGYACGTVAGVITRRYHGLLIAALPAPYGRYVMLNHVLERVRLPNREVGWLGDEDEVAGPNVADRDDRLVEFRVELGLPVWVYRVGAFTIEKRVTMPHTQNTIHATYSVIGGDGRVRLVLRPSVHFRPHEAAVNESVPQSYTVSAAGSRYEVSAGPALPTLRLTLHGERAL